VQVRHAVSNLPQPEQQLQLQQTKQRGQQHGAGNNSSSSSGSGTVSKGAAHSGHALLGMRCVSLLCTGWPLLYQISLAVHISHRDVG
jgi:hypothetical protein